MPIHFQVAEMASGSYWHLAFLRWSMVAIFIWFGIQKFTPYAAEAIAPLIANSPFMNWLSVLGVRGEAKVIGTIELTTAAVLIIGSMIPIASAVGAAMACGTFLLTTSFFFSTLGLLRKARPVSRLSRRCWDSFCSRTLRCLARPLRCFWHLCHCDLRFARAGPRVTWRSPDQTSSQLVATEGGLI